MPEKHRKVAKMTKKWSKYDQKWSKMVKSELSHPRVPETKGRLSKLKWVEKSAKIGQKGSKSAKNGRKVAKMGRKSAETLKNLQKPRAWPTVLTRNVRNTPFIHLCLASPDPYHGPPPGSAPSHGPTTPGTTWPCPSHPSTLADHGAGP